MLSTEFKRNGEKKKKNNSIFYDEKKKKLFEHWNILLECVFIIDYCYYYDFFSSTFRFPYFVFVKKKNAPKCRTAIFNTQMWFLFVLLKNYRKFKETKSFSSFSYSAKFVFDWYFFASFQLNANDLIILNTNFNQF